MRSQRPQCVKFASFSALTAVSAGVWLALAVLPVPVLASSLETTIDLNYTYEQTHLGSSINDKTSVQQKYEITYETGLTSIYELLANVRLEIEDTTGSDEASVSSIAPSLELEVAGPRLVGRFAYDGTVDKTKEFEETGKSESYSNSYLYELELQPYYWPDMAFKYERKREYEVSRSETLTDEFKFELRKDIGDFKFEFDLRYNEEEKHMPVRQNFSETEWSAKAAYQSVIWWDMDLDLTYEITESYSEDFTRGVFTDDEEEYVHKIQGRLQKSLQLLQRLKVDLEYEYEFEQDLLQIEEDYNLNQKLGLLADMNVFYWLDVGAEVTREAEEIVNLPPIEKEETLNDTVKLTFDADPARWLSLAGKAEWDFERKVETETGASVDMNDKAIYELAANHRIGDWWDLKVTAASEYEYIDDWLEKKDSSLKAELDLSLIEDLDLGVSYEIKRITEYTAYESLDFRQSRERELKFGFDYTRDISSYLSIGFSNELTLLWSEEVDEVLDFEAVNEITEDTTIKISLVDFINNMTLEGEIARQASDTEDDEEPMLVDITYSLKWLWEVRELTLESTFKYDDNGDTFDQSTFNSRVAWTRDNLDVTGEYQFDKTYVDEIDETRKINLKVNVKF